MVGLSSRDKITRKVAPVAVRCPYSRIITPRVLIKYRHSIACGLRIHISCNDNTVAANVEQLVPVDLEAR